MGKLKDKLIDMGGYTKAGSSSLRGQDREVGPSQARMKGIRTADPISTSLANKLDEIETAAKNKDKTEDKNKRPDFSKKVDAEYPDQQKELKDLYETGISDKDIAAAKGNKKGGMIKKMASGGKVSQLAKANGCAVRGKTRGTIC